MKLKFFMTLVIVISACKSTDQVSRSKDHLENETQRIIDKSWVEQTNTMAREFQASAFSLVGAAGTAIADHAVNYINQVQNQFHTLNSRLQELQLMIERRLVIEDGLTIPLEDVTTGEGTIFGIRAINQTLLTIQATLRNLNTLTGKLVDRNDVVRGQAISEVSTHANQLNLSAGLLVTQLQTWAAATNDGGGNVDGARALCEQNPNLFCDLNANPPRAFGILDMQEINVDTTSSQFSEQCQQRYGRGWEQASELLVSESTLSFAADREPRAATFAAVSSHSYTDSGSCNGWIQTYSVRFFIGIERPQAHRDPFRVNMRVKSGSCREAFRAHPICVKTFGRRRPIQNSEPRRSFFVTVSQSNERWQILNYSDELGSTASHREAVEFCRAHDSVLPSVQVLQSIPFDALGHVSNNRRRFWSQEGNLVAGAVYQQQGFFRSFQADLREHYQFLCARRQ